LDFESELGCLVVAGTSDVILLFFSDSFGFVIICNNYRGWIVERDGDECMQRVENLPIGYL